MEGERSEEGKRGGRREEEGEGGRGEGREIHEWKGEEIQGIDEVYSYEKIEKCERG